MNASGARKSLSALVAAAVGLSTLFAATGANAMLGATQTGDDLTTVSAQTHTSFQYKDVNRDSKDKFFGQVHSGDEGCLADRDVTVFKLTRSGSKKIGRSSTSDAGNWQVKSVDAKGRYYVTVSKDLSEQYDEVKQEYYWLLCKPYSSKNSPLKLRRR